MERLKKTLNDLSVKPCDELSPVFFRLSVPNDRLRLDTLLGTEPNVQVHDELIGQLQELVRALDPTTHFTTEELGLASLAQLGGTPPEEYGVWVYYPWSRRLVHLLDEEEFILVRTDRNRNKITKEEQEILRKKKIGVIGLSVGQSVSLTLALERSCGEIRLADHDALELSNLNRIRSGVHEMGSNKAVNVAREIAELDPFLKVICFTEGLTRTNIDRFFTEGGPLDILVEECDSVDIKIIARQKARKLGIPVVMDMSDRGCLDVERFDLDPQRPIMHGWIDHLDLQAAARPMTNEEKIPFMLPIVGTDSLSPRMKASMIEMGQTIGTWPQLASAVVLGGAVTGDTCRRIALEQFTASGRWYVDLEKLISQKERPVASTTSTTDAGVPPQDLYEQTGLPPLADGSRPFTYNEFLALAEAGSLAPSAGNMQPWSFQLKDGRVLLLHDRSRSASRWDPDHLMAHIALGACLENMLIKAKALGLDVTVLPFAGEKALIAALEVSRRSAITPTTADQELARGIALRCTNRKVQEREMIADRSLDEFDQVIGQFKGCRAIIFKKQEELNELADICAGSERIRILDPIGHREFFEKEVRWTREEADLKRDGLDLATMELSPDGAAAMRIASDPKAMAYVNQWGGGKALEKFSKNGIRTASAVLLVMAPGDQVHDRIMTARAAQQAWIRGNLKGIAMHPISAPIFMFHAVPYLKDLLPKHEFELRSLEERFSKLLKMDGHRPLFMLRLTLAGAPSVRSVRLSVKDLIVNDLIPA